MTLSDIVLSLYASRSFVSELYGRIIKQPLSHITVEWSKFSYSLLLLDDEKMMQDAERCPDLLLDDRRCEKLPENAQTSCFVNRSYDIISTNRGQGVRCCGQEHPDSKNADVFKRGVRLGGLPPDACLLSRVSGVRISGGSPRRRGLHWFATAFLFKKPSLILISF